MKKTQILFAVFAMIVSASCAIPLAHVEAQQEFPRATVNGCAYFGQGGNGNYARVNGLAYDAGDFFDRAAVGNMGVINACADLDMVHGYTDLYKTYAQNVLYAPGQGDEDLRNDLKNTKAAVKELSDNVVDLATIATPQGAAPKAKSGKQATVSIVSVPAATTASASVINAPPPAANPAPIDPTIAGRIRAARNNAELIGVLRTAAQADRANAPMFNGLADAVARGSEDSFGQNQKTLAEAFAREGGSR